MADASAGSGNRWIVLVVLTFARTAMGFQFQSVGAVSPLLVERLQIVNAELGWLIGLFSLPGVFLALPGGLLGSRFGDRRVVLAGFGFMTMGSALMGAAGSFHAAVVGRSMSAVGAILLNVLLNKMIVDWFAGREIIFAMTVLINAWPVGIGLALFTLPAVAGAWGVPAVFYVAAGVAGVGGLAFAALGSRIPATAAAAGSAVLWGLSRRETRLVSIAAVPWMVYNVGYSLMLGFVPLLLVRRGFSVREAGLLVGVSTLLIIGSVLLGGVCAQWLARPDIVVAVGVLAFTLGLGALPYAPPWPALLAVGVLGGLPAGTLASAPTSVLRPESRGPGMGLFYTVYYAGMALLPPVAGRVQDALGGSAALLCAAGAILAALPSYAAFRTLSERGSGVDRPGACP